MATNGESAANWLKAHGESAPLERLQQIRDNIAAKLEDNAQTDEQHLGLLEALDVMDTYIMGKETMTRPVDELLAAPDLSPLCGSDVAASPVLSDDEKKKRFVELLKTGSLPPVINE